MAKGPEKEFVREAEMLCDVQTRMQQFEQEMMDEVMKRKRKLEDDMKQEIETKRLKFQKDIEDLETEKIDRERRLQLMEGQLKERMQLVADEQTQLDELKEKKPGDEKSTGNYSSQGENNEQRTGATGDRKAEGTIRER